MENFGLLRLLNALLPQAPLPEQKTEAPPQPTEPPEQPPQPHPNACLHFFEAHEQQAQRRKK